jgi:hypothetical protein
MREEQRLREEAERRPSLIVPDEVPFALFLNDSYYCQIATVGRKAINSQSLAAGLPDDVFKNQKNNLGKFWRFLQQKIMVYFMAIWYILWPFGIFYGHLVYFMVICYIFPRFGMLYQEKSGNPA